MVPDNGTGRRLSSGVAPTAGAASRVAPRPAGVAARPTGMTRPTCRPRHDPGPCDARRVSIDGAAARGGYEPFPPFAAWLAVPYDATIFRRQEARLEERRAVAGPAALDAAVVRATREAAVDTGAIEGLYATDRGFTRTVATQAAAWESIATSRGENVLRSIHDALAAYDFVLDAATRRVGITEVWVRELHAVMCRSQDEFTVYTPVGPQLRVLPKGVYKSDPNSPTNASTGRVHHYASPLDTPAEMARLVRELRSPAFADADPVVQAAYAHYCYVGVHPFADGNGRVARALASVFLYRRPGVPLVVFADQRALYLDALEAADAGRPEAFTAFVDERVADTIGVLLANIRAPGPTVTASLEALRSTHAAVVGSGDLDRDAVRVATVVDEAFSAALAKLDGSPVVAAFIRSAANFGWTDAARDGFRVVADDSGRFLLYLRMDLGNPRTVGVWGAVFVSTTYRAGVDLLIASQADPEGVEVARREVDPVVTESLRRKVEGWVEGQLESALQQLAGQTTGRP